MSLTLTNDLEWVKKPNKQSKLKTPPTPTMVRPNLQLLLQLFPPVPGGTRRNRIWEPDNWKHTGAEIGDKKRKHNNKYNEIIQKIMWVYQAAKGTNKIWTACHKWPKGKSEAPQCKVGEELQKPVTGNFTRYTLNSKSHKSVSPPASPFFFLWAWLQHRKE